MNTRILKRQRRCKGIKNFNQKKKKQFKTSDKL